MSEAELYAHLGERIMNTCRVLRHDPFDADSRVDKGTMARGTAIRVSRAIYEHDIVIGCGIIEPSYLCGWSGVQLESESLKTEKNGTISSRLVRNNNRKDDEPCWAWKSETLGNQISV